MHNRFFFRPSANRQREQDTNLTLPSIRSPFLWQLTYDVLWEAKEPDFLLSHGKEYTQVVGQNREIY